MKSIRPSQTPQIPRGIRIPLRLGACLAAFLLADAAAADPPGGLVLPPEPPPPVPVIFYSGLWTDGAPAARLHLADDLAHLHSLMASELLDGYQLAAFESWLDGGTRRYAGLFRSNVVNAALVTGLSQTAFETERAAQFGSSRRLIDIEVELVGTVRTYSGLFASALGTEAAVYGVDTATFEAEIAARAATQGLATFDTWWEGGEQKISGIFRSSVAATEVAVGLTWHAFKTETSSQYWSGRRLIDLEITEVPGGNDLYSGRFRTGSAEPNWLAVQYTNPAWLTGTDLLMMAGHDFSAVDLSPESVLPDPTDPRKDLLDIEMNLDIWLGMPNHLDPVHNCGTPGPPRPPECG